MGNQTIIQLDNMHSTAVYAAHMRRISIYALAAIWGQGEHIGNWISRHIGATASIVAVGIMMAAFIIPAMIGEFKFQQSQRLRRDLRISAGILTPWMYWYQFMVLAYLLAAVSYLVYGALYYTLVLCTIALVEYSRWAAEKGYSQLRQQLTSHES